MTEEKSLEADPAGFLIGDQRINPTRSEISILLRLREDIRMLRGLFAKKEGSPSVDDQANNSDGVTTTVVAPATPRLSNAVVPSKPMGIPESSKIFTTVSAAPIVVKVQPIATPKIEAPESKEINRVQLERDAAGRFVAATPAVPAPAKSLGSPLSPRALGIPVPGGIVAKPVLQVAINKSGALESNRDQKGRFSAGEAGVTTGGDRESKGLKILGDIKDKIGSAVGGSEEVDPNIKAAQEIAGVAGGALNGIKAVGSALGTVATPMVSGFMNRAKPNDSPTPWFKRFYNELRGLRREESVFNRAQLRTLKEIEAKPGEGKGGGFMGMLMMLIGPLIAAIGAALMAGFGLLMKVPGMGMLAKLGAALVPAALMAKKPITQPSTVPGGSIGQPGVAQKKPSMWERAKSKVAGWTGKGVPEGAAPVPGGAVGAATEAAAKKPGLLARAGKGIGGVLKRVPLLGALLSAVSIGADVYSSESDYKTTRAEKDKTTGKAIGGGGGAIAGMMAGGAAGAAIGALGGPIGIAIGGVVGSIAGGFFGDKAGAIVGEKIGAWVADLRNADIPGKLMAGWAAFTSTLGDGFNAVLKKVGLSGAFDKAKEAYSGAKDKAAELSLEAKRGYSQATGKPIELNDAEANAARRQAAQADPRRTDGGQPQERGFLGTLADGAGRVAGKAVSVLRGGKKFEGFGADVDGHIAEASKRYGLPEDVLRGFVKMEGGWTGAMSPTGAIGTGQFVKGTWDSLAKSKDGQDIGMKTIGADFRTPNDPRFDNRTNTLATGLLAKQNADTLTKAGLPATGENLYMLHNIGPGVIPALKGSNNVTPETVQAMRHNGLKDGMSATDFVTLQKGRFNQAYAEANDPNVNTANKVPTATAAPAMATLKPVTVTNAAPAITAVPASTAVVTAGARAIPQMQSMSVEPPKIPDFQPVTQGLASTLAGGKEQRPSVVVMGNKSLAGRDLSNRPLAHIVTGGLSGGGQG